MIKAQTYFLMSVVTMATLLGSSMIGAKDGDTKQEASSTKSENESDNLLLNPSFEEGSKLPEAWSIGQKVDGVTFLWDKQKAKTGKASLCLKKTANRYFPIADMHQTIDRKDGAKSIKIGAQVKAEGVHKAILDVLFLDKDSEWVSHHWISYIGAKEANDPPVTHDWKEYGDQIEIPPTAKKIQINLQIYGPGKVWFDDVTAEYVE